MDAETWMTAAEAVEYGFANHAVTRDLKDDKRALAPGRIFSICALSGSDVADRERSDLKFSSSHKT